MNMFIKVSAHAAVMGGLIAMTWVTFNIFSHIIFSITWPWKMRQICSHEKVLMLVLFVAGLVGTCRVGLKAHSLKEVYIGYGIGLINGTFQSFILILCMMRIALFLIYLLFLITDDVNFRAQVKTIAQFVDGSEWKTIHFRVVLVANHGKPVLKAEAIAILIQRQS